MLKERFCAKRRANRSLVSWGHYGVIVYKVSAAIQTEQHLAQWSVADVQLSLASGGPWCRPPAHIAQWHPLFSRLTACWMQWLRPARGMTSHRLASFAACSSTLQQPHSPTALSPAKMLNVLNREPGVVVNSQIAHRVPGRYTLPPHAGGLLDRRPAHCGPVASRRRR